jgi:AraC family ethanolamine operon transcriptional activator
MLQTVEGTVSSHRIDSDDPDAIAAGLVGGEFEYLPIPGRPFAASLNVLRVGELLLQHMADAPHIARAAFRPDIAALILPIRYRGGPAVANGIAAAAEDGLLVTGGAEVNVTCPDATEWAALALPMDLLEELAELAPPPVRRAGGAAVLRLNSVARQRLRGAITAAMRLADDLPEALAAPGCVMALGAAMHDLLESALADDVAVVPAGRATREAMRVLRGTQAYLDANLHRPILRDELRSVLGVSHRKLHDALVATVGMAPAAYLKLRRLALARRALRRSDGGPMLVKSVALSHGFWHLGYFAQDYRAVFGELPSATVASAREAGGDGAGRG